MERIEDRVRRLPLWQGEVTIAPLGGGMTIAGWLALTLSAIVRRSEM